MPFKPVSDLRWTFHRRPFGPEARLISIKAAASFPFAEAAGLAIKGIH